MLSYLDILDARLLCACQTPSLQDRIELHATVKFGAKRHQKVCS